MSLLGLAVVATTPVAADRDFAVLFAPGLTQAEMIGTALAAGGTLRGLSRLGLAVLVAADGDYPRRARAAGALFVAAARGPLGCTAAHKTRS